MKRTWIIFSVVFQVLEDQIPLKTKFKLAITVTIKCMIYANEHKYIDFIQSRLPYYTFSKILLENME